MFLDGKFEVPPEKEDPSLRKWFGDRGLKPRSHFDTSEESRQEYLSLPTDRDVPATNLSKIFDKIIDFLNKEGDVEGIMGFS